MPKLREDMAPETPDTTPPDNRHRSIMSIMRMTSLPWLLCLALLIGAGAPEPATSPPTDAPTNTNSADTRTTDVAQPAPPQPAEVPLPTAAATIPGLRSGSKVAIIRIEGMIYDYTLVSLKQRVERARQLGATVIVIELDTPGGLVTSALDISKYIKSIDVPTIAWVNNEAYSGGIMTAAACDAIVMSPSSATGDCAPIVPGQNLAPTERAKALSPVLTEFRDSAQQNGYEYALFHAMCVAGIDVYKIQNKQTGETRLVNQADYAVMVEGADPNNVTVSNDWMRGVLGAFAGPASNSVGAPTVQIATEADRGQWQLVKKAYDGQSHTLLTLTQTEAVNLGLAKAIIANDADLQKFLGAASVFVVTPTWSEQLAGFLTSPIVRIILVIALVIGGFIEFQAPGLGIGGVIAIIAAAGLFGGPYLAGLAQIWHIVVFLIGVGLLVVELFVIPGFGIAGVTGIILMFLGLALSVVPSGGGVLPPAEMWGALQWSMLWLMLAFILSVIAFMFLTRYFGAVPLFTRLILHAPEPTGPPNTPGAPNNQPRVSGDDAVGAGRIQPGHRGRVVTKLRPIGKAEIDGQLVDVICEGDWLEVNTPIRVVNTQGNRILVEPDDDAPAT